MTEAIRDIPNVFVHAARELIWMIIKAATVGSVAALALACVVLLVLVFARVSGLMT